MGSITFDFLTESMLFDDSHLASDFSELPEADLRNELQRYREFCLNNLTALKQECPSSPKSLVVFTDMDEIPEAQLKQCAFYIDTWIMDDPVFAFTFQPSSFDRTMREYFKFPPEKLDRRNLARVARRLKGMSSMVAADYIKLLPFSFTSEPPADLPVMHSDTMFSDMLPLPLMNFFRERAEVYKSIRLEDGWAISKEIEPCRGICIRYKGDYPFRAYGYHLFESEVLAVDDDAGLIRQALRLPDTPPDPAYFQAWVAQSIHQSALHLYQSIFRKFAICEEFNASLLSSSELTFDLLNQSGLEINETLHAHTANTLLRFELPFIEDIDIDTVMKIRLDGEAFHSFRLELESKLKDLRLESDQEKIRVKVENIFHEIKEVQVRRIEQHLQSLRRKGIVEAILVAGSLAASIPTGGLSLIGTFLAGLRGYKTWEEYRRQKTINPVYFLWKVLKDSGFR